LLPITKAISFDMMINLAETEYQIRHTKNPLYPKTIDILKKNKKQTGLPALCLVR
jgi:hypothetical protein